MSTIAGTDAALDLIPETQASRKPLNFLGKVRTILQAMHDGHVAARRYQELTAGGMRHDVAARRVFLEVYAPR